MNDFWETLEVKTEISSHGVVSVSNGVGQCVGHTVGEGSWELFTDHPCPRHRGHLLRRKVRGQSHARADTQGYITTHKELAKVF